MNCPKCGYAQDDAATACEACGLIFARYEERREDEAALATGAVAPPGKVAVEEPPAGRLDRAGRRALLIGAPIGVVCFALPFLDFVLGYLSILVHELGHAIAGWLMGFPSVPAFDFVYGGGVTILDERNAGVLIVLGALWAWAFWRLRRNALGLACCGVLLAAHALLAFTPAHETLHMAAGHLSELVFAAIFLYRALSGAGCFVDAERPLYAGAATFVLLKAAGFAGRLMSDAEFRGLYEEAKGGGKWMDLSRIAEQFGLSLRTVAGWLLLLALLTPALTWFVFAAQVPIRRFLARALEPNP